MIIFYVFFRCLWHGCPKCMNPSSFNTLKQKTNSTIYYRHCQRIDEIKKRYKLVEIWECEFDSLKKTNDELKYFLDNKCNISDALIPRDALTGGRTENVVKIDNVNLEDGEQIMYVDFTSLYPSVQKQKEFMIGHPDIITEFTSNSIDKYFGLVKCIIVPPKGLHLPILPYKCNNKLTFVLCRTCIETLQKDCNHDLDQDRQLTGTWTTIELKKAIEKGYRIVKLFEVWNYPNTTKYDSKTKTDGLFSEYVNTFLKIKQEASGYPANVVTEADKDDYIQRYYENEGVLLDKNQIKVNPGMRSVAKLLLNSFWGRFAMNSHKYQTKYLNTPHDWFELLSTKNIEVSDNQLLNEDVMMVTYKENSKSFDGGTSNNNINVVLASFVTSHARLRLYEELEKLNERVIYYDTDSIIFKTKPGQYMPPLGNYLGELTSEISEKQGYITKIILPGPKNYVYEMANGEVKTVIKGFTLNQVTKSILNIKNIENIVENEQDKILQVPQKKFKRSKDSTEITVANVLKNYGLPDTDKRVHVNNNYSKPYGF